MKNKGVLFKKTLWYIIGMFIMNMGIAFAIRAQVGIAPQSSLTRVMSVTFPVISQGMFSFLLNFVMFGAEYVVSPSSFSVKNFAQLIPAFISGLFLDLTLKLTAGIQLSNYIAQLSLLVLGCTVLAFGLYIMIQTEIILMPIDAFVSVYVKKTKKTWGNVKTGLDIVLLITAATVGLVTTGKIMFIREGTLINAIITGQFIKMFTKVFSKLGNPFAFEKKQEEQEEQA